MFTVENYLHPLKAGCLNFWAVVFILGHSPIDRLPFLRVFGNGFANTRINFTLI
jgi:hypothetical protein